MDTLRENPTIIIAVILTVLCCVVGVIYIRNIQPPEPGPNQTPLSDIVIQKDELPQNFLWEGRSSNCGAFLFLPTISTNSETVPKECYQVKFVSNDRSIIILNAIWVLNSKSEAEYKLDQLSELAPKSSTNQASVLDLPSLGSKCAGLETTIKGWGSMIYTSNLFWYHDSTLARLSIINYNKPTSSNDLYYAANLVQTRMQTR